MGNMHSIFLQYTAKIDVQKGAKKINNKYYKYIINYKLQIVSKFTNITR